MSARGTFQRDPRDDWRPRRRSLLLSRVLFAGLTAGPAGSFVVMMAAIGALAWPEACAALLLIAACALLASCLTVTR